MSRDLVAVGDLSDDDLAFVLAEARRPARGSELAGVGVSLVFEHPSLRTRAAAVAAVQLMGGRLASFTGSEVGLDTRERAEDVARTLESTSAIAGLRVRDHGVFARMRSATAGRLRLINLLSDREHPTQAIADALALADSLSGGDPSGLAGRRVAYVGDANNVARSLAGILTRLGAQVIVASPPGYQLEETDAGEINARARHGGHLSLVVSPEEAAAGADALYTDVWISMGQEAEAERRRHDLAGYQLNDSLAALAPDAVVMHCLPAHRGEEITDDVLESERSIVWDQVRHRTSAMLGVLAWIKETV